MGLRPSTFWNAAGSRGAVGQGRFPLRTWVCRPEASEFLNSVPRVSALIVSYNTCALVLEAIASVVDEPGVETIVVDNASADGSPQAIGKRFPGVKLICAQNNLGFAGGVNRAAAAATGEALLVLNSDARLG